MVSQGAMSQRCLVADADPRLTRQNFILRDDGESGGQWRAVTAFTPSATDYALELFADHAIDGATSGAAEEDRCIKDR
jgi:hypothetical protein